MIEPNAPPEINLCRLVQTITFAEDPQPDPPACLCEPKHVAKIAETEALSVAAAVPKDEGTPEEAAETEPREVLRKTVQYLEHNRARMDYPEYRRQGLPITTAWMESLVKEINDRVKGTEMFWNDPEGAEAILQVRAAALCDDERLVGHLNRRPGCPFTRRPRPPNPPPAKIKS